MPIVAMALAEQAAATAKARELLSQGEIREFQPAIPIQINMARAEAEVVTRDLVLRSAFPVVRQEEVYPSPNTRETTQGLL